MTFTFLGTSAGEQFPGFWCGCPTCEKARSPGGRNIRKNSCAWISPDTLIDLSPEVFMQAERFGIGLRNACHLLVTHSHTDHFHPWVLGWRRMAHGTRPLSMRFPPSPPPVGPRFSALPTLHVYGSEAVCAAIRTHASGDLEEFAMELHPVTPLCEVEIDGLRILPLAANHTDRGGRGLNYVLTREGRTILYALDTGWFLPETYERMRGLRFDLAVIEGTFGYGADMEEHMNFRKIEEAHALFLRDGLLGKDSLFCVSHICPHFSPVHDEIAPVMAEKGITIAYDGMTVAL